MIKSGNIATHLHPNANHLKAPIMINDDMKVKASTDKKLLKEYLRASIVKIIFQKKLRDRQKESTKND